MNTWKLPINELPPMETVSWTQRVLIQLEDGWIGVGIGYRWSEDTVQWVYDDESPVDVEVVAWMAFPPKYVEASNEHLHA